MENLDIFILSSIVTTLFVVFIVYSIKELMSRPVTSSKPSDESGPRANMIKFVGSLFDSPFLTKEQIEKKMDVYNTVYRTISDMESDGVYFPDDIKKELIKKREELKCEYSNLPSVSSYEY